jgi:hypothetical protein
MIPSLQSCPAAFWILNLALLLESKLAVFCNPYLLSRWEFVFRREDKNPPVAIPVFQE